MDRNKLIGILSFLLLRLISAELAGAFREFREAITKGGCVF